MGLNGSEQEYFFTLILSLSRLVLAWKETSMTFYNFFTIFLEFPLPGPVGMVQDENFLFLSFSASPVPFWLEKKPYWCFLMFSIFLLFFWNSLFRVRFEWIRTIIFFFLSFSAGPVPSWLLNKPYWSFWIFLLYFQNSIFWIGLELAGTIFFFSHS